MLLGYYEAARAKGAMRARAGHGEHHELLIVGRVGRTGLLRRERAVHQKEGRLLIKSSGFRIHFEHRATVHRTDLMSA